MPQGRIVLKAISQSKKLAELKTDGARLLFTWLIPSVDVNGCFSADPTVIKGQIFTRLKHSPTKIKTFLDDLVSVGLIIIYEANEDAFLCIPDHKDRQPHLNPEREAIPIIPPPTPDQLQTNSRVNPLKGKDESKVEGKGKTNRALPFIPPCLQEVIDYARNITFNLDAQHFLDYYESRGWMIGKNKMKDWRAAVRTWQHNENKGNNYGRTAKTRRNLGGKDGGDISSGYGIEIQTSDVSTMPESKTADSI